MSNHHAISPAERRMIIHDLARLPFPRVIAKSGRSAGTLAKIAREAIKIGELV